MSALELAREYHDSGARVHFIFESDCPDPLHCSHLVCLPCVNTFHNVNAHGCFCEWVDGQLVRS